MVTAISSAPLLGQIAPFGDAVFLVGPDAVRLQVVSIFVRTHSKVFEAMLGTNFAEGQKSISNKTKTISLPEDDADALWIIFSAMHGRTSDIPDPLEPDMVLRVAYMADKYDCSQCLKYLIKSWMEVDDAKHRCRKCRAPDQRHWKLMAAAYYFRNEEGFEALSNKWITEYTESYLAVTEYGGFLDPMVLVRLCVILQEKRVEYQVHLLNTAGETLMEYWENCSCSAMFDEDEDVPTPYYQIHDRFLVELRSAAPQLRDIIHNTLNIIDYATTHHIPECRNTTEDRFVLLNRASSDVSSVAWTGKICMDCIRSSTPHSDHPLAPN
ncbi:hypothetical protein GLAREA_02156 [Glarea lozoyensis ATCC 20868]|uniref:Uncharacterized protein n=1 Tax=Glarea lozoyensis (strain ATCC 20868 / MF5171) TaxID=1116229 RepID=S3CM22_GLAL2|nr:uncharacterized protein GLAREA_02156 [Glarea lozoyensis ATCC 20868]EPE26244.1 hypothetical protein GLAREA_02156 [Glarea lozoyensis ATCC 20868]